MNLCPHHPTGEFPLLPQTTGLLTYGLGAALMVLLSLCSREQTKYWDLGKAVNEMNVGATA